MKQIRLENEEREIAEKQNLVKKKLDEVSSTKLELLRNKREVEIQSRELSKKNELLAAQQKALHRKELDVVEHEIIINKRIKEFEQHERDVSKKLDEAISKENYIKTAQEELNKSIELQNKNLKRLDEIKLYSDSFKTVDYLIDKEAKQYKENQFEHNSFNKFIAKIKIGISAMIKNIHDKYNQIINELKESLFGHINFFKKENKWECDYKVGYKDIAECLTSNPLRNLEEAVNDCKSKNYSTINEAINREGQRFLEKHFDNINSKVVNINNELKVRNIHRNKEIER